MKNILLINKDHQINRIVKNSLEKEGYTVNAALTGEEGLKEAQNQPSVIIVDTALPDIDGLDMLARIREITPESECIAILSPLVTKEEALYAGAHDFLEKPFTIFALTLIIEDSLRAAENKSYDRKHHKTIPSSPYTAGKGALMAEVQSRIALLVRQKTNVLISGEKGTGKEDIAGVIHKGRFGESSFVSVNLASLPWPLQEPHIFGIPGNPHEKGGFSKAAGGTLFIGSVEKLTKDMQERLVAALKGQAGEVRKNVHLISSATVDIDALAATGEFNKDLMEIISMERLAIPPLRMRGEDILAAAKYFLNEIREKTEAGPSFISSDVEQYLLSHDWPENVKQLERTIKKACLVSKSDELTKDDLHPHQPESIAEFIEKKLKSYMSNIKRIENFNLYETVVSEVERALFLISLKETKGNQLRAAKLLGISRNTLKKKIDQLHINVDEFKETPESHSFS